MYAKFHFEPLQAFCVPPPPPTSVGDPNDFCSDPDLGPFISYTYNDIFHDVIWPDPDPYPHKMIESGSDHKVWIRVDPDPQHCPPPLIISFIFIIAGPQERVGAHGPDPRE